MTLSEQMLLGQYANRLAQHRIPTNHTNLQFVKPPPPPPPKPPDIFTPIEIENYLSSSKISLVLSFTVTPAPSLTPYND